MKDAPQSAPQPHGAALLYRQLLRAREAARLTQEQLAQRSSVARPTIYRCESGRYDARLSTVSEMAHALGLELMLVPTQLSGELAGLIRSKGRLPGRPAGSDDSTSALEQLGPTTGVDAR